MATDLDPIADYWYRHLAKGQAFRVVDTNREASAVEIQYFDGDLDELDLDAWYEMEIELTEAPENWSAPLDVVELDDLGTEVTDTSREDWAAPLEAVHVLERAAGAKEESNEEWGGGHMQEVPLPREI